METNCFSITLVLVFHIKVQHLKLANNAAVSAAAPSATQPTAAQQPPTSDGWEEKKEADGEYMLIRQF